MNNCMTTAKNHKVQSKIVKFWIILLALLLFLIPIAFIYSVISDRISYKDEAVRNVRSLWGGEQFIHYPELYYFIDKNIDKEVRHEKFNLNLEQYSADIKINTEIRKKGVFSIPVYTADVLLQGEFVPTSESFGKKLTLSYDVSNSSGFVEEPRVKIGELEEFSQNTKSQYVLNSKYKSSGNKIPFSISYKIRGINKISASVNADKNKIKIVGNWKNPSFEGKFLPNEREVNDDGFSAEWRVPKISFANISNPDVKVSLLVPVDSYRMTERALKYAILFLSLTFLSYFVFEITSKESRRIHPLQYALLGASMLVFYLLLVSLSEFMSFVVAYIVSALMVIFLINAYTYFVITKKNFKFTALIYLLLVLLYIFLYVLLSLQDFSLLIGSVGLFIIIALIMYATRNVNWYAEE